MKSRSIKLDIPPDLSAVFIFSAGTLAALVSSAKTILSHESLSTWQIAVVALFVALPVLFMYISTGRLINVDLQQGWVSITDYAIIGGKKETRYKSNRFSYIVSYTAGYNSRGSPPSTCIALLTKDQTHGLILGTFDSSWPDKILSRSARFEEAEEATGFRQQIAEALGLVDLGFIGDDKTSYRDFTELYE